MHSSYLSIQSSIPRLLTTKESHNMSPKSLAIIVLPLLSLTQGAAILNARQGVAIPAECDVIPTWEVTSFNWFNSSNNLDCVTQSNARKLAKATNPRE